MSTRVAVFSDRGSSGVSSHLRRASDELTELLGRYNQPFEPSVKHIIIMREPALGRGKGPQLLSVGRHADDRCHVRAGSSSSSFFYNTGGAIYREALEEAPVAAGVLGGGERDPVRELRRAAPRCLRQRRVPFTELRPHDAQ
eukprot:1605156-Pyramimonas_sp.AAC.1